MTDQAEKLIKQDAKRVRKLLKGGIIYGVHIDRDNPDHLLAAAYYFGLQAGQEKLQEFAAKYPPVFQ